MLDEVDLEAAAAKGLIGEDQAIALRNFMAEQAAAPLPTQEKFQLASSLADVTRAIGFALVLFCTPIGFGQAFEDDLRRLRTLRGTAEFSFPAGFLVWDLVALLLLAGIWLYLKRHRASIRTSPATAAVLMVGGTFVIAMLIGSINFSIELSRGKYSADFPGIPFAVASGACLFQFWRMTRFPPTLAFACLIGIIGISTGMPNFSTYGASVDYSVMNWVAVASAVPVFGLALWFDLTDIRRETWRSQVAFWLHIVAGSVFSRGLFGLISGQGWSRMVYFGYDASDIFIVFGCVVVAFLISLALDRRAMLMSMAIPSAAAMGIVGLIPMGGLLILASYKWTDWRKRLLARLPRGFVAQLPRTDMLSQGQRPTRRHKELLPRTIR
ncbi:hypothetical protein [Sphingopyxis fribergensis]